MDSIGNQTSVIHCTMYWNTLPMANLPRRSWYSIVGIMTRLQTGWPGVQILAGARDFSLIQNFQTSGVHSTSYTVGTGVPSCSRAARAKVNHSSSPTVKNKWSYTSSSLCSFIIWISKTLPLSVMKVCSSIYETRTSGYCNSFL